MTDLPFRVQPALDDENRFFWTSGADGVLRFARLLEELRPRQRPWPQ